MGVGVAVGSRAERRGVAIKGGWRISPVCFPFLSPHHLGVDYPRAHLHKTTESSACPRGSSWAAGASSFLPEALLPCLSLCLSRSQDMNPLYSGFRRVCTPTPPRTGLRSISSLRTGLHPIPSQDRSTLHPLPQQVYAPSQGPVYTPSPLRRDLYSISFQGQVYTPTPPRTALLHLLPRTGLHSIPSQIRFTQPPGDALCSVENAAVPGSVEGPGTADCLRLWHRPPDRGSDGELSQGEETVSSVGHMPHPCRPPWGGFQGQRP